MVSLVDTVDSVGDTASIEKDLKEAVTQNTAAAKASTSLASPQQVQQEPQDRKYVLDGDNIPVKLRGKTPEEVAEIYANLERAYGRMANDYGTQRQLTDRLLGLKRESDLASNSQRRELPSIKSTELLENPAEVIDRVVSERIQALKTENAQQLSEMEASLAREKFVQKHSDYETVAADPEFTAWIQKSQYRMRAANAAYNGDWAAADELLSDYKERKNTAPTPKREESRRDENLEAARAASLESGAPPEGAGAKSGKKYRRADLIRLRLEKPDLYYSDDFQSEIMRAYAEKRVI